jgi:mono/diheme cytochrome c family protein
MVHRGNKIVYTPPEGTIQPNTTNPLLTLQACFTRANVEPVGAGTRAGEDNEEKDPKTRLTEVGCGAAMSRRTATLFFAVALAGLTGGMATHAHRARQEQSGPPLSAAERARLLAKGKEIFLARCARCHGEDGDKPLRTGVPLRERGLPGDVIARAVKGRLADGTDEERRGVAIYVGGLMRTKDAEGKAAPRSW